MNEIWKDIEGYEGLYQVSNLGRVKSLERIDSIGRHIKEKILRPVMRKDGYLQVSLRKEGKGKNFLVHRLVAQAFIPNPEGLREINHKDENKTNNLVDNLEYCDRKYNNTYGTCKERMVQTKIRKGLADPDMCGMIKDGDRKEHDRMYYQKNRERLREYQREYRRRKKSA